MGVFIEWEVVEQADHRRWSVRSTNRWLKQRTCTFERPLERIDLVKTDILYVVECESWLAFD
jgi:hypothetical protein